MRVLIKAKKKVKAGYSLRIHGFLAVVLMVFSAYAKVPEWVANRTADTDTLMYSVGSGASLDDAKSNALSELAGKVSTQVEQLYLSQERAVNEQYDSQVSIDTQLTIAPTDLKYFYVNQTQQSDGLYWVEMMLDKSKMAEELLARFTLEHDSLLNKMSLLSEQSAFVQFLQGNEALVAMEKQKQLAIQLKFYRPNFNATQYSSLYNGYIRQVVKAKAANHVLLDDAKADATVAKEFRTWLAGHGVNLIEQASSKADVIELSTQNDKYRDNRDAYIVNLQITANVTSPSLGQIGHTTIKTKGRDYKRSEDALDKAIKSLKLKLNRKAPAELLNLTF